jgi:hypothetical protein
MKKTHTISGNKRFMTKRAIPLLKKYGIKNVSAKGIGGYFLELSFIIDDSELKKLDKELKRANRTAYGGIVERVKKIIKEEVQKLNEEKLPKLQVPSDVSYYNRDWGKVFEWWSQYRNLHYGPRESDMYDWNDRSHYRNVTKEYNAHMKKIAKKLNDASKPLETAWKEWNKILEKHRKKDRS